MQLTGKDKASQPTYVHPTLTLLLAASLSVAAGIAIPTALAETAGDYSFAALLVGAIGAGALVAVTFRWPLLPLLIYWGLYSFLSVFQLSTWRVLLGGIPVTVSDAVMLLMAFATGVAWLRTNRSSLVVPPSRLSIGMVMVFGYGLLSAALGAIHGFSAYAIGIDLRELTYLVVGYASARLTLRANEHQLLLAVLFVAGFAGLVIEQTLVTLQELARLPGLSVSIAALRDIGAPYYLGKYGIFLLLLLPLKSARQGIASVISTLAGLAAIVATFIRTAWLEVAVGIIIVALLGGRRAIQRILIVLTLGVIVASALLALQAQVGVIAQAAQGRLVFSQSSLLNDSTIAGRLDESRAALANLRNPLDWIIGVGLGVSVTDELHPNQHNSFVWALSKQGIVGLMLFSIVIVVIPLVVGLRAVPSTAGLGRALLLSLLAAHIANALGGYASGNLTFSPYTPLLGMSLAWIGNFAPATRGERVARSASGYMRPGVSIAQATRRAIEP